jgi:hypothetical protein
MAAQRNLASFLRIVTVAAGEAPRSSAVAEKPSRDEETQMRRVQICAAAVAAAALVFAATSPSQARDWGRGAAAAGVGFAAGAAVGAAAASSNNYYYGPGYYDPGYAYDPAPYYGPGYAYDSGPYYGSSYAYAGEYTGAPGYAGTCWVSTDSARGFGYYGSCADTGKNLSRRGVAGHRTENSPVR